MATLERHGVRIDYEVHGQADGPAVLLTHGYGASRRMWDSNIPALAGNHKVIAWDMRGHGSSAAPTDPGDYSHHACVEDMAELLDAARAPRAVLIGMSLGGYLSLAFRLRFPERVSGLVLVDTGPGFRDDAARKGWNQHARDVADRLEREGLGVLGSPENRSAQHEHGVFGLAQAARGMLVQEDGGVMESLAQIEAPTLIVVGAHDTQFLRAADAMERRISGARKLVLDGAGHAANMDAPDEFNRAVGEFLAEIEDQAAIS
jgi:pimeloyl-ACP methyl ester carboxylesterase